MTREPKRGPGRPPLPVESVRKNRAAVRASDAEWARIQSDAKATGVTVAEWVRRPACECGC